MKRGKMNSIRVIAIPTKLAERVRATLKAPGYGHPAHIEVATGYGPCRHCLHTCQIGEEQLILFTYEPFHDLEPLPLPCPICSHAEPCHRREHSSGLPTDMRSQR